MRNLKKIILDYYGLLIILTIIIVLVLIPFLTSNNLEGFDTAGHLASVNFIKYNFWPWPDGWNHYFLSGFPQGLFYPSFFHWLVAAFSFFIPVKIAFKLILSLSILAFIFLSYFLSLKLFKNKSLASLSLILIGFFYFLETGLSDNMFTDLFYGMVSHLFSLTIFIAYIYLIFNFLEKKITWFWPGIFLSLTIISHVISGLTVVIFALFLALFSFQATEFIRVLKHIIFAMFLSSFWWLPFIININYTSGSSLLNPLIPTIIIYIPIIIIFSCFILFENKKNSIFIKTVASINVFFVTFYLIGNLLSLDSLPIHLNRFLIYPFILSPLIIISVLKNFDFNWRKINLIAIFFFIYLVFFFRIIPVGPFSANLLPDLDKYYESGRVIVTGNSRNLDSRFHINRMTIAQKNAIPVFGGLFVESSVNGPFIMSLLNDWGEREENFVWAYMNLNKTANLEWNAKIFGINYEYNISDNSPLIQKNNLSLTSQIKKSESLMLSAHELSYIDSKELFQNNRKILLDNSKIIDILGGGQSAFYYQTFYKVANNYLAEALSIKPYSISSNWSHHVTGWWSTDWLKIDQSDNYTKPILIWKTSTDDWNLADTETGLILDLHKENRRMDLFTIDASTFDYNVPIYVKVSYFPFWHAYNEAGEELKIYKASPNFMLVYAHGKIVFKYIKPWYYYFTYLLSGLSFLIISAYFLIKKINKTK